MNAIKKVAASAGITCDGSGFYLVVGLVDVGLLRYATRAEFGLGRAVYVLVPQQGTACQLLGFQLGLLCFELVDKNGGFGLVIGAAEEGHKLNLSVGSGMPQSGHVWS
jgi:hypothetical protein